MNQAKLGLGTVQFGLNYGATNTTGQVPEQDVRQILAAAAAEGITVLDTAAAYGTSEAVLGRCLSDIGRNAFSIMTKTVPLRVGSIGQEEQARFVEGFNASLERLQTESVAGLLLHHAEDVLVPGGERLYQQMIEWQQAGKARKIGVSAYDGDQLERLFSRYTFDLIQVPVSVFDQRLVRSGVLADLARRGVEIHARSIFLQGTALAMPESLPPHLRALKPHLTAFRQAAAAAGTTPLAAALAYIIQLAEVSVALVGVLSIAHLQECVAASNVACAMNFDEFAVGDIGLIDPRRWPAIN